MMNTAKEVAQNYGERVKFEWVDLNGEEWLKREGTIDGRIIREVENKTIRNVELINPKKNKWDEINDKVDEALKNMSDEDWQKIVDKRNKKEE